MDPDSAPPEGPGQQPLPPQWPAPSYPPSPAVPGYGYPRPPGPVQSQRRRRGWILWAVLGLVALLVVCGLPAALVIVVARVEGGQPGSAGSAPSNPARSTAASPSTPAAEALRTRIDSALRDQGAALRRGDEAAFLAVADPTVPATVAELKRRYRSLRALKVERWSASVDAPVGPSGPKKQWVVPVTWEYCVAVVNCSLDPVNVSTTWVERAGKPLLVKLGTTSKSDNGPLPWEVSDLRVALGPHTVVATTARYAGRLPMLLREAERAAAVVEPFVVVHPAPDRFRIFYAGSAEWRRWYGGGQPEWSVGQAIPVSRNRIDVVVRAAEIEHDLGFLDDLLRHEMTHVATLRGARTSAKFWMIEGIADYVAMLGRPFSAYDSVTETRRWVHGGWDGDIEVAAPTDSAPDWQVAARYGVSMLAMRCLAARFGQPTMMSFFGLVVNGGYSLADAATTELHADWTGVAHDCADYVRSAA
jgi:hypothetical protein